MPAAICAALLPTMPPPNISTFAGFTPGTPPNNIPFPPCGRSKKRAPSWVAILPATSLIGINKGNEWSAFSTVSYARQTDPFSIIASVSSLSEAK